MFLVGYVGLVDELKNRRTKKGLFFLFIFLFVLIACLRIDSVKDLGDLEFYIDYFKDDYDSYFEPGYVFVTNVIKTLFGHNSYALVTIVALWVVICTVLASKICSKHVTYNRDDRNHSSYYLCLFFLVCFYWGCFFSWQTLRIGLAIPILYCSSAFAINGKKKMSLLVALFSILFHTSCVIFLLGMIIVCYIEMLSKKQYQLWFVIILVFSLFSSFVISLGNLIESVVMSNVLFSHYIEYLDPEPVTSSPFSPQTIAYLFFGYMMLKGDLANKLFNRAVLIYYLGLTAGVVFAGTGIAMRIQWLFLAMVIFPLYYFAICKRYPLKSRISILLLYTIIEQVMTIRQFGWYI
jgi:hypothetical protein